MTTTDEPAPDLDFEQIPDEQEANNHRALIRELDRQHGAAVEAAAAMADLADSWHEAKLDMPALTVNSDDALDRDTWTWPAGRDAGTQLADTLRSAAHQAYAISGHYQRVARRLGEDLAAEQRTPYAAFRYLALDELGQLGYVKPSDEWVDGHNEPLGRPGSPLQLMGHKLQQAGLLPAFDEAFAPGRETSDGDR